MRTELDDTPEYKESVREAIVAWDPDEAEESDEHGGTDEHALDLASCYLWWNGYKNDKGLYCSANTDDPNFSTGNIEPAYFVYDVLRWTEANT